MQPSSASSCGVTLVLDTPTVDTSGVFLSHEEAVIAAQFAIDGQSYQRSNQILTGLVGKLLKSDDALRTALSNDSSIISNLRTESRGFEEAVGRCDEQYKDLDRSRKTGNFWRGVVIVATVVAAIAL